jgi:hypothetical protein
VGAQPTSAATNSPAVAITVMFFIGSRSPSPVAASRRLYPC